MAAIDSNFSHYVGRDSSFSLSQIPPISALAGKVGMSRDHLPSSSSRICPYGDAA